MSNFDLLDTTCDDIILISEDFCLDKSFDILINNFQFFETELNKIDDQNDRVNIIRDRFNKNKEKYYKLLTFVNQFSASLENVHATFNRYRDTWQTKNTPLEVVYEKLVYINDWGTFNQKTGNITRKSDITNVTNEVLSWANRNFIEEQYATYKNIKVRVYITADINDTFTFNGKFKERCGTGGVNAKVCCNGCGDLGGCKGCNRMGPDGRTCGNMYRYCPASVPSRNCVTGACKGWKEGSNKNKWQFQDLSVSKNIIYADTYLIGFDTLTLVSKNSKWELA